MDNPELSLSTEDSRAMHALRIICGPKRPIKYRKTRRYLPVFYLTPQSLAIVTDAILTWTRRSGKLRFDAMLYVANGPSFSH